MDLREEAQTEFVRPARPKPGRIWERYFTRRSSHSAHYERVLGTSLELQISAVGRKAGPAAEQEVLAEIDRLEAIFNAYSPASELSRWQRIQGEDIPVSPELLLLLSAASRYTKATHGAFNPAAEALTQIWREAEERQQEPEAAALERICGGLAAPLWELGAAQAKRLTPFPITLNSIAKGYIIDCAAQRAAQSGGVREVLVNIGGDLAHLGDKPITVAIANPFTDAENAEPLDTVQICNQGLATSGNYRRGFQIGEQWFSHVIDPRSGRPVEHVVSASVIANCAERADVMATAFSVLKPEESLEMADSVEGIGVLIIGEDGRRFANSFWQAHRVHQQTEMA